MCLAHSKHSVNITFHPCFTYSSLWPSWMPCSSRLVSILMWYINLDYPNTPPHPSTPNWKPIPVSHSWKYHNNLYVPFFWSLLFLFVTLSFMYVDCLPGELGLGETGSHTSLFVVSKVPIIAPWLNACPVNFSWKRTVLEAYCEYWKKWGGEVSFFIRRTFVCSAGLKYWKKKKWDIVFSTLIFCFFFHAFLSSNGIIWYKKPVYT